jgi:hypothetical protein
VDGLSPTRLQGPGMARIAFVRAAGRRKARSKWSWRSGGPRGTVAAWRM